MTRRYFKPKGLASSGVSTSISVLILLIVVMSIAIPFIFYLQYSSSLSQVSSDISNNYVTLHNDQYNGVVKGKPSIFYVNSSSGSSVNFQFVNGTFVPQTNFVISKVLVFSQSGVWNEIPTAEVVYPNGTKVTENLEGLAVNTGMSIQFNQDFSTPVAIVTTLGNVFFLSPGSSIGPYVSIGKGGFIILSQAQTKQGLTGLSTEVVTNVTRSFEEYKTPVTFSNVTGTYLVNEPEQYVYFTNSSGIYTAQFQNWYVIGNALTKEVNSTAIRVTLEGTSVVLVANYSVITSTVELTLVNSKYSTTGKDISVCVDGVKYQVPSSYTVKVRAGYVNLTDLTTSYCVMEDNGQERSYFNFSSYSYNGAIYTTPSSLVFIPPTVSSAEVDVNYYNGVNCFEVSVEEREYNGNGYPNGVAYINPTPSPQGETVYFNGTGENLGFYVNSFWIKQGNYSLSPTGTFFGVPFTVHFNNGSTKTFYAGITWGSYVIDTSTGQKITNGYYYVNSPVTIYFYYAYIVGFNSLV